MKYNDSEQLVDVWNKINLEHAPSLDKEPMCWFSKVSNKKVLDCGCGFGAHLIPFAKLDYAVFGIDISSEVLKKCKENLAGKNIKAVLKVADIRDLPFKDEFFDVVFSMGVVEHLQDYGKAVAEKARVLKKNGLYFIGVPYRWNFFVPAKLLQQALGIWKLGHEKSFTIKEVKHLLKENNLEVLKVYRQKIGVGKVPLVSGTIRFLDNIIYPFGIGGHFLYVLARKN